MAAGIIGLIGTALAILLWWLQHSTTESKFQKELDDMPNRVAEWERKRDEALSKNNDVDLTVANAMLIGLRDRKTFLLQRLGKAVQ